MTMGSGRRPHLLAMVVLGMAVVAVALLLLRRDDVPEDEEASRDDDAPSAPGPSQDLRPPSPPDAFVPPEHDLVLNPAADIVRMGDFHDGNADFTTTSALRGDVELVDHQVFRGERAIRTTVRSPNGYAFARVQEDVHWDEGDEVWYGAAIYLDEGFKEAQGEGSVDILRWDNWPEQPGDTDHGGLTVLSDGRLALFEEQHGNVPWTIILGPYDIPERTWVWLEVRQRFSLEDGEAINEVWMDGRRLGTSTAPNHFGRTITRHRVGIIATPDPQPGELRLYLDHPVISRNGPIMEPS